jgi:hypothetical protein
VGNNFAFGGSGSGNGYGAVLQSGLYSNRDHVDTGLRWLPSGRIV